MSGSIPTAPAGPRHHNPGPSTPGPGTSTSSGSSSGTSSSSSSGGGGGDSYAKAQRKAAQKYLDQVRTLQQQANALQAALGKDGFRAALNTKLANLRRDTRIVNQSLMKDYRQRLGGLEETALNNEKDAGSQAYANLSNAGRERANAMSEAMAQGAGESDMLRAQGMALRNWNANQNEIARSYSDTKTSIDSSLTDMTADVRASRINAVRQANADRDLLWTNFNDRSSEAQTNLGNIYGQMADYLAAAQEMGAHTGGRMKRARRKARNAWDASADFAGEAYESPGVPKALRQWDGAEIETAAFSQGSGGREGTDLAKPEGASLRRWDE